MPVTLTPAVHVHIKNDFDLVRAFHEWVSENHIYSVRNAGGGSGCGQHSYTYSAEDAPAISQFFKDYKKARKRAAKEA